MKTILLIGLGRFGRHIVMKLNELKHQVMAVDQNEERVNAILPFVTNAQIGDSTSAEFLADLGVRNFDVCIVAIGDNFQSSLETASLLKELGAHRLLDDPALLHHHQGGDAHDAELTGQLRLFVHVDLGDLDVAPLPGDLVQDGAHHPARGAPGGPEVQQDGAVGIQHFALEIISVDMDH